MSLLSGALLLYVVATLIALLGRGSESLACRLASLVSAAGALLGLLCAVHTLASGDILTGQLWLLGSVRCDGLSAVLLLAISLVGVAASLYATSYLHEYEGKGAATIATHSGLFLLAMTLLVVVDSAIPFLLTYEIITLVTWAVLRTNPDATRQARLYLLLSHVGMVLVLAAFWLLCSEAGSFSFSVLREHHPVGAVANHIFLLGLLGFGLRAGFMPLHGWLPDAEPMAPSHVSALMSGVMVKLGLFGILRLAVDLLGVPSLWWGYVVLFLGCASAVLGVLYALAEHDLKRLLAYHTVENIGIILMGMGIGMIGIASGQPMLTLLGLLGALYHLLNHAVFKSLLFMGTGSVMFRLHTRDMDKMGGLARRMPWTALAFLIGAMSISALPPLNGFVSEWFIYQSLLGMSRLGSPASAAIGVVMLAVTGAMAVMCFVKVYGVCFGGEARSAKAAEAVEVPLLMRAGTLLLAASCLVLGLGSPWIAGALAHYAQSLLPTAMPVSQGSALIPTDASQAILSTPVIAITLLGLLVLPWLLLAVLRSERLPRRQSGTPWACGYAYDGRMSLNASAVTHTLRTLCAPLYRLRPSLDLATVLKLFPASATRVVDALVVVLFVLMLVGV